MSDKPLTPKQEAFALKYVECSNQSEAYRHAYDVGENTKPETVWRKACEVMANGKVSARVFELQEMAADRAGVTIDMVISELAKVAFSDLRNVLTPSGQLINPQDWDDATAGAISSLEVVTTGRGGSGDENEPIEYTHKIKTWDKNAALEKLGKHLGMYVDRSKVEVSGPDGDPLEISPSDKLTELLSGIAKRSGKTS